MGKYDPFPDKQLRGFLAGREVEQPTSLPAKGSYLDNALRP